MTQPRILGLMALMREIEKPSACYFRAVRRASQTLTDSLENDAAQARGHAALLEIEKAVREWVAKHPGDEQSDLRAELDKLIRWHKEDGATIERMLAERTELIRQRDQIAMDTVKAIPAPADRAALTEAERAMLTYALDQAQEHIWSRDGFTDEGQAAVTSLRRLADEAQQPTPDETDALTDCATEYRVPVPENGGEQLLVRRQAVAQGVGWAVSVMARGGGRAWTTEGWQDSIIALSVDRLFCWPDAATAVVEARRALTAPAEPTR